MQKHYDLHDALDYITFWITEYASTAREIAEFGDKYVEQYSGRVKALQKLKEVVQFWIETNEKCEKQNKREE